MTADIAGIAGIAGIERDRAGSSGIERERRGGQESRSSKESAHSKFELPDSKFLSAPI
jgi:hypothetical protein